MSTEFEKKDTEAEDHVVQGGPVSSGSPCVCLFQNKDDRHLLDLHTNRIFSLQPGEAAVIEKWLAGEKLADLAADYPDETSTIQSMQKQGLFSCILPQELAFGINWEEISDVIRNEREHTVIEITQQCNLRCKYCTYGGGFADHRLHSSVAMSHEMVIKAVDSTFQHSSSLDEISIGFYGGEPLLEFAKIKAAVAYAQEKANGNKKIRFSMTTNATLMDEEIATFLLEKGFYVTVSLDGPQYMHDRYRVYSDGSGSYADTIQGLRILLHTFPTDCYDKIALNMVVPSSDWTPYLEKMWDDEPWIPRTLSAEANIVNAPEGFEFAPLPLAGEHKNLRERWIKSLKTNITPATALGWEGFESTMAKIHQRPVFDHYRRNFFPNGCCIPGARRIFIGADGKYGICERVHGAPTIGSLDKGVDFASIRQIIDEYNTSSFKDCRDCFAISLCKLCYADAYENGRFSQDKKRAECVNTKASIMRNLQTYVRIGKEFPHKLDEWDKVVIS